MSDFLDDLCKRVELAARNNTPLRPAGGSTKNFYGGPLQGEEVDMRRWAGIVEYEPTELVITVKPGTPLADVEAALAAQTSIEFGLVVRSPMIQIETIGAGGGSIASVDASGMLQVGPESAGSVPGPACYDRGNTRPTVTDANVLLGRIAADRPLGGGLLQAMRADLSEKAIQTHVAEPLGLSTMEAAEAILTVANAKMAGAVRVVSIEKGHDPRQFAYMPFGGGGGLHVCAMMREVGVATGIVPRYPGVTSALGCVMADMRHDAVQTLNQALSDVNFTEVLSRIDQLAEACQARLDSAGVRFVAVDENIALDMLFTGQPIDAATALRDGLVSRVVPPADLDRETMAFAQHIAAQPPQQIAEGKAMFHKHMTMELDQAYAYATEFMAGAIQREDAQAGIDAFVSKKPKPDWTGR